MSSIRDLRERHREEAIRNGIDPRDVDLLLGDALGRPLAFLIGFDETEVDPTAAARFHANLARRLAGEPVQYIRGRAEFYGRELRVDRRVLIPRPETEILVEEALAQAPRGTSLLDVGTGSGCIAITAALERRDLTVSALDRSVAALSVARENAHLHQAPVRLLGCDLLQAIRGRFGVVVSNPPYIAEEEMADLAGEVRNHEPLSALTPGPGGLQVIERLLREVPPVLGPEGVLLFEIGWKQSDAVREMAESLGWSVLRIARDLAGIPRVVVLRRA